MTVAFEVGVEFLAREDLELDAVDLRFGLERDWLGPRTVMDWATIELSKGSDDPVVEELACLLPADAARVPQVLAGAPGEDAPSCRKWLYLQLKAAYERRDDLGDPLMVVSEIYAEFDYPPEVTGFVYYMPPRPGEPTGTAALMERWRTYLDEEHAALRRKSSPGS